jgi:hypothetical protein
MTVDTDIAWAAGFLDGEGHFGARFRSGGRTSLGVELTASQTHKAPIDKLVEIFGGAVHEVSKKTTTGRTTWQWTIASGKRLREVLPLLIPYLTTKKQEAEILLELSNTFLTSRSHGGRMPCTPEMTERRKEMISNLKSWRSVA